MSENEERSASGYCMHCNRWDATGHAALVERLRGLCELWDEEYVEMVEQGEHDIAGTLRRCAEQLSDVLDTGPE